MEVIDNFLQPTDFDKLKNSIMGNYFPWFHFDEIVDKGENNNDMAFYSVHMLYDNDRPTFNTSFELMDPILNKLKEINYDYRLGTLVRVKINSYPNQNKFIEHNMHQDFPPSKLPYKACLFSLNTCDGYTKFEDGTKVESVANRAILFDPTLNHCSTNTTNQTRRVNININYL